MTKILYKSCNTLCKLYDMYRFLLYNDMLSNTSLQDDDMFKFPLNYLIKNFTRLHSPGWKLTGR